MTHLYEPLTSKGSLLESTSKVASMALWAITGIAEGYIFVKCLIPFPKVLADQFVFNNFVVLKMFLAAVGSSLVTQALMNGLAPETFAKSRSHAAHSYGLARVVMGLSILGAGMAVAGNGPTMVAPCMGARVATSLWLLLGGVSAVAVNYAADKALPKLGWPAMSGKAIEGQKPATLEVLLGRMCGCEVSYTSTALCLGLMLLFAAVALEFLVDFRVDLAKYGGPLAGPWTGSFVDYPAWPPMLAGLVVGFGQLPVRLVSGAGMGGSGAFVTLASTLSFDGIFPGRSLQASLKEGFSSWQLAYNFVWVAAGALLASFSAGTSGLGSTSQPLTAGFEGWRMALGSFLGILGARIAGGCTCGHGVSGTSELSLESWIGAMAIFGAAITTRSAMVFGCGVQY